MTAVVELDDRIAKCQKILNTDPNSQIFAALAEALRKKGDLDKAFKTCQSGLKIHPDYGPAHTVMAKINLDRGQYDWAEVELNKARELDGPGRASDVLLAEIYIYKGNFEEAISILKTLLSGDPDSEHIKKLLDIAQQIPEEQKRAAEQAEITESSKAQTPAESESLEVNQLQGSVVDDAKEEIKIIEMPSAQLTSMELIKQACAINGILGGMFVNHEGLAVEIKWNAPIDHELCAVTLSEVSISLNSEVVRNSFGEVAWILIETKKETIQMVRRPNGTFVFIGAARINLGPMRMKLTELFDRYKD